MSDKTCRTYHKKDNCQFKYTFSYHPFGGLSAGNHPPPEVCRSQEAIEMHRKPPKACGKCAEAVQHARNRGDDVRRMEFGVFVDWVLDDCS